MNRPLVLGDWVRRVHGNDLSGQIVAITQVKDGDHPALKRYRVRWGREHPNAIQTVETYDRIRRIRGT